MTIDFVKNGNTWIATKTVDNKTVTLTVNDADGDNKIENHDGFKVVGGSISVFGKVSEIAEAISKLVPSRYTQASLDYYKTDEKGNHRFDDVAVKTTDKGKVLTIKQGTEYNVGSLFNAIPTKTTSNTNTNASTGTTNTDFSQFNTSSMMSGFGGGFGGGIGGGSTFTFNPSAVPGLNMMATNAASALAGYCTSPIDSISATSFGAALPGWFTRFFADPTTAYGINNSENMPFLTASAFAKKWSGPIDLKKPIESTSSTSTSTTTTSTAATDEVTFDDGTTTADGSNDKTKKESAIKGSTHHEGEVIEEKDGGHIKKYSVDASHRVWEFYDKDNKLTCKSDFTKDHFKSVIYENGKITKIKDGKDLKNYIEYHYDDKMNIVKRVWVENGKETKTSNKKILRQKDGSLKNAGISKAKKQAGDICNKVYSATNGCGTRNGDLKKATDAITKDNVIEVLDAWSESSFSEAMDEKSMIKLIGGETDGSNSVSGWVPFTGAQSFKYLNHIKETLLARSNSKKAKELATIIDASYNRCLKWDDSEAINKIQELYELVKNEEANK